MITATKEDKALIIHILSESFKENKSILFVVKNDSKQKERIQKLMEYSYNMALSSGEIFLSENKKGCVLLLYSCKKPPFLKQLKYDLDLAINCIGLTQIFKVLKREKQIKLQHPKHSFLHLWYIGVNPNDQGKNIGRNLMKEVLAFAQKKNKNIYLETSTHSNIKFYEKLGFRRYHTIKNIGFNLFMFRN